MRRRTLLIAAVAPFALPPATVAQSGKHYRVALVELPKETTEHKSRQHAFRTAMRERAVRYRPQDGQSIGPRSPRHFCFEQIS